MQRHPGNSPANAPDSSGFTRAARRAVLAYLESAPGASTPADIGWLLMHADWLGWGCLDTPTADQVHATRLALSDCAYLQASGEASARFEEATGVISRGAYRLRAVPSP